jgi:hypothetical protein
MLKTQAYVRRMLEEDGKILVSFDKHNGYFTAAPDIAAALEQARAAHLLVHFTYDNDLNILGVVAVQQ